MGRKPNQLILEFFIRGKKLEDASNRYEHTCKACGEKFPKGRIDSLTNHLVKKCQAIPLRDRQRVLLRLHELPDLADGEHGKNAANGGTKGKSVNLPYSTRPSFDGLNVLAEASRQVGASDHKQGPGQTQGITVGGKTVIVDPALEAEGFHHFIHTQPDVPETTGDKQNGSQTPATPGLALPVSGASSNSPQLSASSLADLGPNARQSTQLSMIAASASEMMPHTTLSMDPSSENGPSNVDGSRPQDGGAPRQQSFSWAHAPDSTDQLLLESLQEHDPTLAPSTQRAASFPRPIAINPNTQAKGFVNDFGNATKPTKPKVRGRFSATRRKEVQNVRKVGACLRCRMLRKPCSGGNPCSTCAGVESARLWKLPCTRDRITNEFELFSAGLYATLAYHDVNSTKSQTQFAKYTGRIEATHFADTPAFVTFSALEGPKTTTANLDPQLQALAQDGQLPTAIQDIHILDGDSDDLSGKLELYTKRMAATFFEKELSDFMRPTLMLASEIAKAKGDALLDRVLELWVITHILVDPDVTWKAFLNPNLPATTVHSLSTTMSEGMTAIDDATEPESYMMICSQLRSAAEKRAAILCKSISNDLERRLLQRQQGGWFEAFLVTIVLQNCVEKALWLFQSWNNDEFLSRWPLDKRPEHYTMQVDRFSSTLHLMVSMRNLPPKASPRPDNGVLRAIEGSDENATKWFEAINITPQFLEQRMVAEFDPHDSRSLELKYGARILQPTTCFT